MNLCNKDHDEVCFEGKYCPVCEAHADAKESVSELQSEIKELQAQIASLEAMLNEPVIPAIIQAQNQNE